MAISQNNGGIGEKELDTLTISTEGLALCIWKRGEGQHNIPDEHGADYFEVFHEPNNSHCYRAFDRPHLKAYGWPA